MHSIAAPARDRAIVVAPKSARGLDHEERPQALAPAERGVAHGLDQATRARDLARSRLEGEHRLERALDAPGGVGEPKLESVVVHAPQPLWLDPRRGRKT